MPDELIPPARPQTDPPSTPSRCPECGCEFDGISVTHASEWAAALREENSLLKKELAAEKNKPAPAREPEPQPQPQPQPAPKKRGGMLYGKRAAA